MEKSKLLSGYHIEDNLWDEMYSNEGIRNSYATFVSAIDKISPEELSQKSDLAKKLFMTQGVTFTVYDNGEGIEKIFPFDVIPRIIKADEWKTIEAGIKQRLKALNIFFMAIKTFLYF